MLKAYADFFVRHMTGLTTMIARLKDEAANGDPPFSTEQQQDHLDHWMEFQSDLEEVELSDGAAARLCAALLIEPHMKPSRLCGLLERLKDSIEYDLHSRYFLYIPAKRIRYWQNKSLFGEEANKIPDASEHIYEAGCCFALSRSNSTVYHCMGVVQAGLFALARNLGATIDPEVDDWSSASKKIDDARKDLETKSKGGDAQVYSDWKRTEAQLADIMAHFRAMTYGWRHPTAHYRQSFTDERAGQILEATKAFVQAVAEFLERPQGHQG